MHIDRGALRFARAMHELLTPDQMGAGLAVASPRQMAFLCLGGFAGLRTSEALGIPLEDVEEREIFPNGKTGRRVVERLGAFDRHWPAIVPASKPRAMYMSLEPVKKAMGIDGCWPDNCLRHSFASYHLAMWGDAGKTAYQLGHTSLAMVYRHYARAVRKADAEAWWNL